MSKKIFRSIITVAMTVLFASIIVATSIIYNYFNNSQIDQLKNELSIIANNIEEAGSEYFEFFDSSIFRFTLVSNDGTVLYDTQAKTSAMDNHIDREEIQEALKSGSGSSKRYSSTLTERTLYEAVLLENGNVLRISVSQLTIGALILAMLPAIMLITLIAIIVSLVLSSRMANIIVKPLSDLDLENPTENNIYEELSPILSKINKQHKQITTQLEELRQKADEFKQITSSMNEGLVILDRMGTVLSINPAAEMLFDITSSPIGRNFLTVDRSPEMTRAIECAANGRHSEFREQRNGGEYQFVINRIESGENTIGIIILCFDVTQTAFAEKTRREFTANVSHELKTPLQSIIGSAELLESGLVKPDDTQRFIGNIKNEAIRLVALINDIIRLSQLDESSDPISESVDLYAVAKEVVDILSASAAKRGITLHLHGESCVMNGIHRYLYEAIYNLCDNAIRYNTYGGTVTIDIINNNGNIALSVSDTGIGIPPQHQSRVFERFYRVDKSHSKETGGTGLGLSIVKHTVELHGGTIKLSSEVNKGTVVKITF